MMIAKKTSVTNDRIIVAITNAVGPLPVLSARIMVRITRIIGGILRKPLVWK